MATAIHPTAVVEPGARLGEGVAIGPYCCLGPEVELGKGVTLHSHVVIAGRTQIGAGTTVYPFSSLGHPPQDLKYKGEPSRLLIGYKTTIREHVTVNTGTEGGGMQTRIGDNCLLMAGAHVAHDCVLGDGVVMANQVTLGGHVSLGDGAIIGGLSAVHQFVRIGRNAMIGGMSGIEQDVIPFGLAVGDRASLTGLNLVGLRRRNVSREEIAQLGRAYRELFEGEGPFTSRVDRLAQRSQESPLLAELCRFLQAPSERAILQPRQRG